MVLVDVDIIAGADDAFVFHDTNGLATFISTFAGGEMAFTRFGTNPLLYGGTRAFFLFRGITIPMNATIDDATLTMRNVTEGGGNPGTITIRAIQSTDPSFPITNNFQTSAGYGNQYMWDRGSVGNAVVGNAVQTENVLANQVATDLLSDVTTLVQELVDSFSYVSDSMMFRAGGKFIAQASYPTIINRGNASVEHFENVAGIAKLTINFTADQICVPTSDISNAGAWSDTQFGNGDTALWDELDESILLTDDDTSAVKSPPNPQPADTFEVKLDPCIDPLDSTDHVIKIRVRGATPVKIQLFEGATLRAESGTFNPTLAYQTFEYTLSGVEADSITDYSDLRIRVVPV